MENAEPFLFADYSHRDFVERAKLDAVAYNIQYTHRQTIMHLNPNWYIERSDCKPGGTGMLAYLFRVVV